MQERHSALPLKLADKRGDEKRGVAFAAMLWAHANRADLDTPVEPHPLASHGGKRALDPNPDIVAELMRARTKRAGVRLLGKTQHVQDIRRTEHHWRRTLNR